LATFIPIFEGILQGSFQSHYLKLYYEIYPLVSVHTSFSKRIHRKMHYVRQKRELPNGGDDLVRADKNPQQEGYGSILKVDLAGFRTGLMATTWHRFAIGV
jgi:hypothetical protein